MSRVKFDEKSKVWTSCGSPLVYNSSISLIHILFRSMRLYGSRMAQISDDTKEQFTFDELCMMSIRAAQNLQKRGYTTNDVTAIVAGDVAHLAPVVFASLSLRRPICVTNSSWKPDPLRMFEMTKPNLVFCDVEDYETVVECLDELGITAEIFTFYGTIDDSEHVETLFVETGSEEEFTPVEVDDENEIAFIMSTSGTTGPSKGFCLTHAALFTELDDIFVKMYKNAVVYSPATLAWLPGIISLVLGTVCGSTRIITDEEFSIELQLRLISQYKLTCIDNLPVDLIDMLKSGSLQSTILSTLRNVVVGGYKVPLSILKEFNSYLPNGNVHNLYGLTETGTVSLDFPIFSGIDAVGCLAFGASIKIIDKMGNRCGVGEDGELYIKSRHKIIGYYKNQKLTDQSLDSEGYFKTGDIGHIDENGLLYIVDRIQNRILHRNGWIYPAEIEEELLKWNEIKHVCVVGISNEPIFEIPAAAIVRANPSQIIEDDVLEYVEDNLDGSCALSGVYFVDSIPTTRTGKPNRNLLKESLTKLYGAKKESGTECEIEIGSNLTANIN